MTYRGKVRNGVVVLPSRAKLPDGTPVVVSLVKTESSDPSFLRELLKLAKNRDWPADFALNHAYYAKGHPRKP